MFEKIQKIKEKFNFFQNQKVEEVKLLEIGRLKRKSEEKFHIIPIAYCIKWIEIDGHDIRSRGTTYAASKEYLEDFFEVLKNSVNIDKPTTKYAIVQERVCQVSEALHEQIMNSPTGIVNMP